MYRSQFGQDRAVEALFGGMRNGVFVELGGMDGLKFSNTAYLEEALGWTGVLIEPNPEMFPRMVENRPRCVCIEAAVASSPGTKTLRVPGEAPGLAGLEDFYCAKHEDRIRSSNSGSLGDTYQVDVQVMTPLLERADVHEVHYMSVDVEGGELEVIAGIDFARTFVHLVSFEANYPEEAARVIELLTKAGFRQVTQIRNLDVFMVNERSPILSRYAETEEEAAARAGGGRGGGEGHPSRHGEGDDRGGKRARTR